MVIPLLISLAPAAVGCGQDPRRAGADDDRHGEDDEARAGPRKDAGARPAASDGQNASRRDGGAARTPGVSSDRSPSTDEPNKPGAEPKQLVTIDECGSDNPAGLKTADLELLKKGGNAGGLRLLYPYDATVFPRGLTAPLYMWDGAEASAVYLQIRSKYFSYDGCLKPSAPGQLQVPQSVWTMAGAQTLGPATPFTVALTTLSGGRVLGPIEQKLVIAQATIKGSIYYNSYDSKLATGGGGAPPGNQGGASFPGLGGVPGLPGGFGGGANGAVLRIKPGKEAEFFTRQGSCTGCHSLSANGKRLIAMDVSGGGLAGLGGTGENGKVYQLEPDTPANPQAASNAINAAFVGLYPDGSLYVSTGATPAAAPQMGAFGVVPAMLYETSTRMPIMDSNVPASAGMPTFSPDGSLLAFTDLATGGRSVSIMNFDVRARRASEPRQVFSHSSKFVGWPFLLPDNGGVVVTVGDLNNFGGGGAYVAGSRERGPASDLYLADTRTKKGALMSRAMGFDTAEDAAKNKTYLPFGEPELHQNYYPTVSPVAAGGYFWVFFDSIRHYGNKGMHRALWATAVRVLAGDETGTASYDRDLSSPAFYLPGQELEAGNHRAFTALDPCRDDGQSCEDGVDCCSGFCSDGRCGPPKDACSDTNESCKTDDDCCHEGDRCIAGFCGQVFL